MPWTTPPWLWPSTSIGLMTVPKSPTIVYFDVDDAGVGIDLDLADMRAVGEGRRRLLVHMADVQGVGHAFGQLHALAQLLSQFHDADAAVGADDGEAPALELDIRRRRLECDTGDLLAL